MTYMLHWVQIYNNTFTIQNHIGWDWLWLIITTYILLFLTTISFVGSPWMTEDQKKNRHKMEMFTSWESTAEVSWCECPFCESEVLLEKEKEWIGKLWMMYKQESE